MEKNDYLDEMILNKLLNESQHTDNGSLRFFIMGNENKTFKDGQNMIHSYVAHGVYNNISTLLRHGANPNLTNRYNTTPLVVAIQKCAKDSTNIKIVNLLLEKGANPNIANNDSTPLCFAIYQDNLELVSTLLTHGADPNLSHNNSYKPIWIAARWGFYNVFTKLIYHGADVGYMERNGKTLTECISESDKISKEDKNHLLNVLVDGIKLRNIKNRNLCGVLAAQRVSQYMQQKNTPLQQHLHYIIILRRV